MNRIFLYKNYGCGADIILALIACTVMFFASCKKTEIKNPYSEVVPVVINDNPDADDLPEGSFAWLHAKVFKPTCANSGCHDGTFEPEFRSMSSAYNSLVNHTVIANTPGLDFVYRVKPGNANESFLHERLTTSVPFSSGMMPLITEPNSDWPANSSFYISKITEWIDGGAKDIYGNIAPSATANMPPIIYGLVVFPHDNTTTPYPREENPQYGIGAIEVPSDLVDVWIYPYDDNAYPNLFQGITLMTSPSSLDFSNATQATFSVSGPISAMPFGDGAPALFYYKTTIDLSSATPGDFYYLRSFLDDGNQSGLTEIPNDDSSPIWFLIFSLKIV